VVVDNAGHIANIENPEATNAALDAFLTEFSDAA
jgi:pimeloyl-ACP methyl ester carboxylesterase